MNSAVCVDASVIIWALTPAPLSQVADALLNRWLSNNITLIAPGLFAFEVTSTLRRLVYLQQLTADEGEEAFKQFLDVPIHLSYQSEIIPLAWRLAKELNFSRAYDATYLALAQLRDCPFWTADERLYNSVHDNLPRVKWIGAEGS